MKLKTVIVDDRPENVMELREYFEKSAISYGNCEITIVLTGINEALAYISAHEVDVVFIRNAMGDYRYSGDSSYFISYVNEWRPETLTVLYSGDPADAYTALRFGACDYLQMPLNVDDVIRVVHHVVDQNKLLRLRQHSRHQGLLVRTKGGHYLVHVEDILFVERSSRRIQIVCEGGKQIPLVGYTMDQLERLFVGTSLYRCYQSFFVNAERVIFVHSDPEQRNFSLRLRGYDGEIYLSRQRHKELLEVLRQNYASISL
ncbi:MAG: LytTR family transcriptional regulator DNA-binding domain-containing protein [Oscillospiraceae bacterium]|nr:LytTR family transcriptional regulator DNA-binding domain-containing protein [Oscillospiraceae bacterium]